MQTSTCRGWQRRPLTDAARGGLLPHVPAVLHDMAASIAEAVAAVYLAEVPRLASRTLLRRNLRLWTLFRGLTGLAGLPEQTLCTCEREALCQLDARELAVHARRPA